MFKCVCEGEEGYLTGKCMNCTGEMYYNPEAMTCLCNEPDKNFSYDSGCAY